MKRVLISATLVMFLSFGVLACGDSESVNADDAAETDASVAIQVDNETITKKQLKERVDLKIQPMLQRFGVKSTDQLPPQVQGLRDQVKRQVVQQSVTQLVLLSHAKQSDVEVTDQELQERWDKLLQRFPSEKQFHTQLEKLGKSPEEFRGELRSGLLMQKFIKQEIGQVEVTDQEIQKHFEQNKEQYQQSERVRARHILFKEEGEADAEAEAKEVKKQLESGANFSEMARKHSDGPSAKRGGSLGTFGRGEMVPAFEKVAFGLEPGVISDPVKTQFGYHLIQVEEKMDSKPATLENSREKVAQQLRQQKRQQKMQKLVQRLREQSEITQNIELPAPPKPQVPNKQGTVGQQAVPPTE